MKNVGKVLPIIFALFLTVVVHADPVSVTESAGACEMYKDLSGVSDESLDCSPGPNYDVCGAYPWDQKVYKQGPDVNNTVLQDNPAHYEACIDTRDQVGHCVLGNSTSGTEIVEEGYVANVAPYYHDTAYHEDDYQSGGNSPDWSVCLNIDSSSVEGEWYNLDNSSINGYLENNEGSLGLSSTQRSGGPHQIDYYYSQNPNPQHSDYNPEGGNKGVSLLADCGPLLRGCGNEGNNLRGNVSSAVSADGTYFAFFEDHARISDYHPQGFNQESYVEPFFNATVNKIKKYPGNKQLSPGHFDYDEISPEWFRDTQHDSSNAVQYAYTRYRNWSVASSGIPYPPFGADQTGNYASKYGNHYRQDYTGLRRNNIGDDNISKAAKAFGNSLLVEATKDIYYADVEDGEGFWIDPDNVSYHWEQGHINGTGGTNAANDQGWRNLVTFQMDLTGPDSGIGYDLEGGETNDTNPGYVDEVRDTNNDGENDTIFADIYWERNSPIPEELQTPLCGDDQNEYLIEEKGQSINPEEGDGRYACLTEENAGNPENKCVSYEGNEGQYVYDRYVYHQTNENGENAGRLKKDLEVCERRPEDDTALWYDQDYGDVTGNGVQDTCDTNSLYGKRGIQWISEDYVKDYPHAVTGGIDDSWNRHIENNYNTGLSDEYTEKYVSRPEQDSWNFDTESPVPSGKRAAGNDSIATLGFCGGDDEGEYFVSQECTTSLCETDRSVKGVAKNPDSCVFEPDTLASGYSAPNIEERSLFGPGERVEVNLGSQTKNIACFNNKWYEDWPIVFKQDKVEVPFGDSTGTAFDVINVQQRRVNFNVEMIDPLTDDPSAYQHSTFSGKDGDSFEVSVPPESSKTFYISIQGVDKSIDGTKLEHDLTVRASAVNSDMRGEDSTTVEIVENNATNSSVGRTEPESVPGIGTIHIMMLILISSTVFFLQS